MRDCSSPSTSSTSYISTLPLSVSPLPCMTRMNGFYGGGPVAAGPRSSPALCFALFLCLWCGLGALRCAAQQEKTLPDSEINALQQIASKLGIKSWDFSLNPCSGPRAWVDVPSHIKTATPVSNVTCGDCTPVVNATTNATINHCHVVSIQLKSQNLTGVLPVEFANLPSLNFLDLSRNIISGTIPAAWASLPLIEIILIGNRISGRVPDEFGNITTLKSMLLEDNLLEGPLPRSLGRLTNLTRLLLSANDFVGELPDTLGNLINLEDFRIDGTGISGKLPSFIWNWTKLKRLDMQGTSLEGPFPPTFSKLENLDHLRITDFKGAGDFPMLEGRDLKYLFLRNCSISGPIPSYIGMMTNLRDLDLSFNNFTGEIPGTFQQLAATIDHLFLTNNNLNGLIPEWIFQKSRIDLSYNSFTGTAPPTCQTNNVNLVSSFSSSSSNSIPSCLKKNLPCSGKPKNFKLFINTGGEKVNFDGNIYEDDTLSAGEARFESYGNEKWAYSSTGVFVGNDMLPYRVKNLTVLNIINPELYMSARVCPSSLKYYGLCLQRGNYTVRLHFAEIMFIDDQTYFSIGRRFFDVSIQGQKVLKDFNIAKAANGTGRAIVLPFNASVEDGTLEIHFQWAGKGTNAIPDRGVYGPLISAISVTPNFEPVLDEERKLSTGAIVGIATASCVAIFMILLMLWFVLRKKDQENEELKELQLQTGCFSLREIKIATGNFNPANKIGEGGFGPVYKGVLSDGSCIAVKQLSSKSKQGNHEFVNEIGMITALQHPNLVKLYGCCIEGNQLLVIYEYMQNNSLARALFGPEGMRLNLDWKTRYKISLGIARGLAYLHEESRLKIVHRDIKATNILLDKDLNAKISDFGLAKLDDEENTHISTRIAGTVGYMAPEYAMRGYLTDKADVYSFGVVILEIVSGKSNASFRHEDCAYLLDQAYALQEQGRLLELVDPSVGSDYSKQEAEQILNLALMCTSESPPMRPTMTEVVMMLEGGTPISAPSENPIHSASDETQFKSLEKLSQGSQGISLDGPWLNSSVTASSTSEEAVSKSTARRILEDRSQ